MLICNCTHQEKSHYLRKRCVYVNCFCQIYSPVAAIPGRVTQPFPGRLANSDDLIQYTADQLDIPYRVSKSDRDYCVYYFGSGKGLIELIIMSNITGKGNNDPWYVTWTTPTTTRKETLAKFTDLLLLIQLLQEGVNAKELGKATVYK